ncbi:MAG: hypothetical protein K0R23_798 [Lacrimispora sp.]|jgi:hypothetical protein|nr:hypothetical protein [Lacrimispora sp.]
MKKRIMAIYDSDYGFGERFAEFVNFKERVPVSIVSFTSLKELSDYSSDHGIELLLISSNVSNDEIEQIGADRVVLLAEEKIISSNEPYPSVYKYQAANHLLREVMEGYYTDLEEQGYSALSERSRVIGVYSPVNRCLKTSFSLTMAQLLSRDLKVLYLNLEDCSGLSGLTGEEYKRGMSDLFYYYRQGSFSFGRLGTVICTWGDLDYVPPVQYPEDLAFVSSQEIAGLIKQISEESTYGTIILDLGQMGKRAADVLEICDGIYMPVKEDCVSAAKVEEFEAYLAASGHDSMMRRIQKINLPYHCTFGRKDNYLDQLLWSELGDFTRQLLRKQP